MEQRKISHLLVDGAVVLVAGLMALALWGWVGGPRAGGTTHLSGLAISGDFSVSGGNTVTGNETIGGTLGVTGAATVGSLATGGTATLGNTTVTGTFATVGNSTLNGTVTVANLSVTGTSAHMGLASFQNISVTGTSAHTGLATFQTLTATGTTLLGTSGSTVGVGTSTALLSDLTIFSGSAAVSSTAQIGSSAHTNEARGFMCLWNGTEYTLLYATSSAVGASHNFGFGKATTTACNVIPAGL